MKGPHFFTLHEKFEELYDHAAETVDTIAERLLAIGGQPVATVKEYTEHASITDGGNETSASEMVQALVNDYKQISSESKFVIGLARTLASRAAGEAQKRPMGPVHVNVPLREPLMPDLSDEPFGRMRTGRHVSVKTGTQSVDRESLSDVAANETKNMLQIIFFPPLWSRLNFAREAL